MPMSTEEAAGRLVASRHEDLDLIIDMVRHLAEVDQPHLRLVTESDLRVAEA